MRRLQRRVRTIGASHQAAADARAPVPQTTAQTAGGAASPAGAPDVMPLALVTVYPEPGGQYSTIGYKGLTPIFTSDGAAVPASAPGSWGQLRAAGRP